MRLDDIGIKNQNWEAHKDIQADMVLKKEGVFTFVVRVNNAEIVDYICLENVKYTHTNLP